ncbi:restriction endonuclease [Mycobacterium marinum]|uniref:restriction endonuclease n=1 Tax=Mycobacterium marinum TaxID=1781 RepID=UPI00235851B7|nr:restriction endonuclease [Mycobacterium marinum]MDC9003763.1 restriction endonuclease [Mycobacterium marinum]
MPAWRDYQEATAAYYRDLGLAAETDVTIEGARGSHKVDVAVRGQRAGVEFLWIVECKHWNRAVPKVVVATLSAIIQDIGADRGIILSRKGFQSGAPTLAQKSNITLTSLDELRTDTEDEYIEYQCALLTKRCGAIKDAIHARGSPIKIGGSRAIRYPADLAAVNFVGRAGILETAVEFALKGRWPIRVIVVTDEVESPVRTENFSELLAVVDDALTKIEGELAAVLARLDARCR